MSKKQIQNREYQERHENDPVSTLTEAQKETFDLQVPTVPGDISNDGVVNAKDITILRRALAGGYGVTLG